MFPITTFSEQVLGDFSTLPERPHAEAAASNSVIACFALFGACGHVGWLDSASAAAIGLKSGCRLQEQYSLYCI